jgi:phosphoribosylformylglycinamidine cyclo-ligase
MNGHENKELDKTISMLKQNAETTFNSSVVKNPDFKFGALYKSDFSSYKEPLLITSADNIGSKLKFAIMSDIHNTIGIDMVGMSVNNIISTGAKPLFFSNYIGLKDIDYSLIEKIIDGVVEGCKIADIVLLGGETTGIPDMYLPGDYDLVGFTVGIVEKDKLLNGNNIQRGDLVLGLYSSGLHFSGFRKLQGILGEKDLKLTDRFPHTTRTIQDIVLTPTRIYTKQISNLLDNIEVHAMKQIADGLYDDINEILPEKFHIEYQDFEIHEIFQTIMEMGDLEETELFKIFNCGVGMVVFIPEKEFEKVEITVGEKMKIIGKVV